MKILSILLFAFLFSLAFSTCYGQEAPDSTILYRIETNDGNEYIGHIINKDTVSIRVNTLNLGIITLKSADVNNVSEVKKEEIRDGTVWYQVLQSSRYFWSPNGYGLKAGEAYYQNIWVMYNQMSFGLSDNFSLGMGMIPLFLFGGSPTPVWVLPKFSIPIIKDRFNIGIGALAGTILGESSTGFGILYGITTLGSHDNNISLGLGYGYAGKSWSNSPVISLSGMIRTGKKGFLMSENYYFSFGDTHLLLSVLGGRSIIRKAGLDYGLALPISSEIDSFIAIPWLGLTIPIESKKQK